MPRARNPKLIEREEAAAKAAADRREANRTALAPRTATINLAELELPEGGELPPRMAQVVALRILGMKASEIADKLAISVHTVNQHLYVARSRGKLSDVGPILDHVAVPLAMDNLIKGLEEEDKEYTLEVLKGRGAFRSHSASVSSGSVGPMQLQIQVELPQGAHGKVIDVGVGQVMGKPRD